VIKIKKEECKKGREMKDRIFFWMAKAQEMWRPGEEVI